MKHTLKNVNTYNMSCLFINLKDKLLNRNNKIMKEEERTYKTIKWILKDHIKKNVKSLWTWKDDNFTCIYENYSGEDRIFTSNQLLNKLNK